MSEEIEFIKSNKGGAKIIHKGYMYTIHKNKKNGGIRWRCARRSLQCRGSISTGPNLPPKFNMPHNHLPDPRCITLETGKPEDNNDPPPIFDLLNGIETDAKSYVLDSMPLEQRMTHSPHIEIQEPILHSQPLSPTKLKVTRHAARVPQNSPKPPSPEPVNEEVCLRWNSHHSNMQSAFPTLLLREQYVDVTLVAEGRTLKCHRLILSSCSPYFEEVLSGISPLQHPVLFMKDIPFWILKSLCDFMYAGEVHIFQNKLEDLLSVAEALKIKGLAGKSSDNSDGGNKNVKSEPPQRSNAKPAKPNYVPRKIDPADMDDVLDPLDLLEPVYEEITKDCKPSTSSLKPKEGKYVQIKKPLSKKIKKRKYSEEREETPPPVFQSRKGTRSRPNVKIPKYYHTHYDMLGKTGESSETAIEHEPHRNLTDPLLEIDEIKSEPIDPDDDVIEIEDNAIGYTDEETTIHDDVEAIMGNYDSPFVNIHEIPNRKRDKGQSNTGFKKISLLAQPIIMGIHSVGEKNGSNLEIIDMSKGGGKLLENKTEDPLDTGLEIIDTTNNKVVSDPLTITAIQSRSESAEKLTIRDVKTIDIVTKPVLIDDSVSENSKEPFKTALNEDGAVSKENTENEDATSKLDGSKENTENEDAASKLDGSKENIETATVGSEIIESKENNEIIEPSKEVQEPAFDNIEEPIVQETKVTDCSETNDKNMDVA